MPGTYRELCRDSNLCINLLDFLTAWGGCLKDDGSEPLSQPPRWVPDMAELHPMCRSNYSWLHQRVQPQGCGTGPRPISKPHCQGASSNPGSTASCTSPWPAQDHSAGVSHGAAQGRSCSWRKEAAPLSIIAMYGP